MTTLIHINRNVIQHNSKYDVDLPVYRVQKGKISRYCRRIKILGPSEGVYNPDNPLKCGAKLWLETDAEVELIDETPWEDIQEEMISNRLG